MEIFYVNVKEILFGQNIQQFAPVFRFQILVVTFLQNFRNCKNNL